MVLLLLIACSKLAWGQPISDERPIASTLMMGIGQGKVRNTYLTNLLYTGTSLDVRYERTRHMRTPQWDNHQWLDVDLMYAAHDNGSNSAMHAGRIRYRYGMHKQMFEKTPFSVSLGWVAGADLGFDYNLKMASGNNPATVRATFNGGISAKSSYQYKLRKQPCHVDLQVQVPLLGAALVPEYGASYYETFYLNHTNRDVHFTSLHNQQDLDVRLTTDIPFSVIPHMTRFATDLRAGVVYHIETMDVNHIVSRQSTFQFVLGWTWRYLPYKPSRP